MAHVRTQVRTPNLEPRTFHARALRTRIALLRALPAVCGPALEALRGKAPLSEATVAAWLEPRALPVDFAPPIAALFAALGDMPIADCPADVWRGLIWRDPQVFAERSALLDHLQRWDRAPQDAIADAIARDGFDAALQQADRLRVAAQALQPVSADPMSENVTAFLARARAHYRARHAALRAAGWTPWADGRPTATDVHASWYLRHHVNGESIAAIANGTHGTPAAARRSVETALRTIQNILGI